MKNKQKVYNVVSAYLSDRDFSCRDLHALIKTYYPGTPQDSIIPSDYLCKDAVRDDPSNDGNRGLDVTYPRFLERTGSNRYRFVGWDGIPSGAIDAPVLRRSAVLIATHSGDVGSSR
jgi:hypothetical protein